MSTHFIPRGHSSICPFLIVKNAEVLAEFLKNAFGGEEISRLIRPDGGIINLQIKIGDSIVMLGERGNALPEMRNSIHLYVKNVDETYGRCLQLGAKSLSEPKSFFYGDRSAGIEDQMGNIWWIGTHEEDVDTQEIQQRANRMMTSKNC